MTMTVATANPIQVALDGIIETLGTPATPVHQEALDAYESGDSGKVRKLAASHLEDHYCRSLGYLISAKLKPDLPTIAVVLAEAARAAADYARERELSKLNKVLAEALG
jgi:hypothetical protein